MARWQYTCEHTGPDTLAGRYMRQYWQPIFVSGEIAPGRIKPVKIMGEDLTLYRGRSGQPYVVDFRCAHRGTQLSVGRVDGEEIRCLYHGWKYDGQGRCVEQPGEIGHEFASTVKIRSHPARDYYGLIFTFLGEGEVPDFPLFPELEGDGVIESRSYTRRCNLTNFIDNALDEVHLGFTHPLGYARLPEIPDIRISRTEFTAVSHCSRPGRVDRITEFLMPTILRFKSSSPYKDVAWADSVSWRVPIDDAKTRSYMISRYVTTEGGEAAFLERQAHLCSLPAPDMETYAERILEGELTYDEALKEMGEHDPRLDVTLQDNLAMPGQGVVANRATETLGQSDIGVTAVRDLWSEQLKIMDENGEVCVWIQPPAAIAASGEDLLETAK